MGQQNRQVRLGIDVGGTNTDAVVLNGRDIVAAVKQPTTMPVGEGLSRAVEAVLKASGTAPGRIDAVMLGTTQMVNAFVQRRHLAPTGIIRVGLPKSDGIPPLLDWPEDIVAAIGAHIYLVGGGALFNGQDYAPLDEAAIIAAARHIARRRLGAVAISAVFSPIRPDLEERTAALVRSVIPDIAITKSVDIGGVGLVDRENGAIINACLMPFAAEIIRSLKQAFEQLGIARPLWFSRNDGTLLTAAQAASLPVMTSSAGPTNSIRGAGFLTGCRDAVIVDIGGTTSDIGFLSKGFARTTSSANRLGGVRTNFAMPDILSIGLGGGSHIVRTEGGVAIGPQSVGHRLGEEAMIFGGATLTASDIAVAAGLADFGDRARVATVDRRLVAQAAVRMRAMVSDGVDQMRVSNAPVDVVLVGGGAVLIEGDIAGAARTLRPGHADVANAIGAAMAQVGGYVDQLYDFDDGGRDAALDRAKQDARAVAESNGARPDSIDIVEIEELPMTHMKSSMVRVKVTAVGDLA